MSADNFEKCLAITLKWEGGYSNHPDDPGGPTMRGIIQREYDAWRRTRGLPTRPVQQIEERELRTIYKAGYWDAMACDTLPPGMDLAVFDAAVNSGVGRAKRWLATATVTHEVADQIGAFCDARLEFLQGLGRLWRVFGAGWRSRVNGIRAASLTMAGQSVDNSQETSGLHAGMKGPAVRELQTKLRALGYPVGEVDGFFGEQTRRAVILFQDDNGIRGDPGVWQAAYDAILADAKKALPRRASVTPGELEARGDKPVRRLNTLQRILGWIFGASVVSGVTDGSSVLESVESLHDALEPVQGVITWASGHAWVAVAVAAVVLITIIRLMRSEHVQAYRDFTYQGGPAPHA